MIKTLCNFIFFLSLFLAVPFLSSAQEAITLSVSPTLYDMSAEPGQDWKSSIRVVNVNKFDLTVYAEVVNFTPKGEGGDSQFEPINAEETKGSTIAEWFSITNEPILVPREQAVEIPFTVRVPFDASPGGHFAAILIGTKPIKAEAGQARLQTAQIVTSLFFSRIAGDIVESGSIREFNTTKTYLGSPEATFSLRFENKGNVHLQPKGEIKIFNMWGQERGNIPINQYSTFGNVLPDSIRKFLFTWKGEWSISDIGRYTAIATLGYGTEAKQFSSSKAIFWVIPFKLLFGIFVGLAIFFGLLTWLVRLYVRHVLHLAGIEMDGDEPVARLAKIKSRKVMKRSDLSRPMQIGLLDLSERMKTSDTLIERLRTIFSFIVKYKLFFLGLSLILVFILVAWLYIKDANTEHRAYEVVYLQNENSPTNAVSSEDIIYNQLQKGVSEEIETNSDMPEVIIINRSGEPGVGAKTRIKLEAENYRIASVSADFKQVQERTVIVAPTELYEKALLISQILNNAPVSVNDSASAEVMAVTIFVGSDEI